MPKVITSATITLIDLNDASMSPTPPKNPQVGDLWFEQTTSGKNILKKWNGTSWGLVNLDLSDLDKAADDLINEHEVTLNNMANDARLTNNERITLKNKLIEVIGIIQADSSTTLPTLTALDTGLVGEVYSARKQAVDVGISTSLAAYTDFGTRYTELKTYLETLNPKPWNTSAAVADLATTVDPAIFRQRWQNYYTALNKLNEAIIQKTKENVETAKGVLIEDIAQVEVRVGETLIGLTDEEIISKVLSSQEFQLSQEAKANADAFADYVSHEDLNISLEDYNELVEEKIANMDLSPYVQTTDFEQTKDSLTASIRRGGGVNVLLNSIGYNDFLFWDVYNAGALVIAQNDELDRMGTGSGFMSRSSTDMAILYQEVNLINGETYSVSGYVNKTAGVEPIVIEAVSDGSLTEGTVISIEDREASASIIENGENYQFFHFAFEPIGDRVGIRIKFPADAVGIVTGSMLNLGAIPFLWSTASGETYNTNVKLDLDGIRVAQLEFGEPVGYTKMTPTKFAAYYDVNGDGIIDESKGSPDEVFRMDKDEFVMKKAVVKSEITLGSVKVIHVDGAGNKGWAFIPNEG